MTTAFLWGLKGPEILVIAGGAIAFRHLQDTIDDEKSRQGAHSFKQGLEDAKEELNKDVVKSSDTTEKQPSNKE